MERSWVVVALAAVAVAGCANGDQLSAPATPTTSPEHVDPLYSRFSSAIAAAGVHVTPPMGEAFRREVDTCTRLREGEYDAFDLQTFGVTDRGSQRGQIITVAIPALCPDQQPALDLALSGTARQTHFDDGKYGVAMVPNMRTTVQPGTYSVSPVSGCYWERRDAQGNIIEKSVVDVAQQVTVTVLPSDETFVSEGCGVWKRVG
jgi:hypothetical protein